MHVNNSHALRTDKVLPGKRTITRQRARTEATRRKLLAAAETIFARDGFEAARLEDIAALAGYTRGAFYANFKSKEDIFFVLLESWVSRRIAEITSLLDRQESHAKRLTALRTHYAQIAQDRGLALLSLEFKLFAIRHPEAHARLRTRQRRFRACGADLLTGIAKSMGHTLPVSGTGAAAGLGALSNALLLEHLVDQATISDRDVRYLLGVLFDSVLGNKSAK